MMQRSKLALILLTLALGFIQPTAAMGAGGGATSTGGSKSTGGGTSTGGTTSTGGNPSVRRHLGRVVEGTSYLTYLCLSLLIVFGVIGALDRSGRSASR